MVGLLLLLLLRAGRAGLCEDYDRACGRSGGTCPRTACCWRRDLVGGAEPNTDGIDQRQKGSHARQPSRVQRTFMGKTQRTRDGGSLGSTPAAGEASILGRLRRQRAPYAAPGGAANHRVVTYTVRLIICVSHSQCTADNESWNLTH